MLKVFFLAVALLSVVGLGLARLAGAFERKGDAEPIYGDRGKMILRYGSSNRVYWTVAPIALALTAVVAGLYSRTEDRGAFVAVFTALWLFSLPGALSAWRRVEITDDAVTVLPLFGHGASVSWSDVAAVEYSRLRGYLTLRSRHGQQVRVNTELQGFKTFVGLVRELLPDTSHAALTRVPSALYPTES
jgi:hypothetical protein